MFAARILGLAFSLILARVLTPGDFGIIQYTLAVANILSVGIHPFGQHVVARFISSNIENKPDLAGILSHAWLVFMALLGLSLGVSLLAIWLFDDLGAEVLAVVVGIALFYGYWGASRGYLAPGRLTAAYLGSNIVQFVAVLLIVGWLEIRRPALALLIYGLSYLPVLVWLQWKYGLPLYLSSGIELVKSSLPKALFRKLYAAPFQNDCSIDTEIDPSIVRGLLRFAIPVTLSHAAFMLFLSVDLIYLNWWLSPEVVGQYALAKTLATAFSFIPMGIATLLMPKIAQMGNGDGGRIVSGSVGASLLVNILFLGFFWATVNWFVRTFFGESYLAPLNIYLLLAAVSILMGIQSVLTAAYVGANRPEN